MRISLQGNPTDLCGNFTKEMKMKKLLAGLILAGATAFNASASVIMFDDSSFGGTGNTFFNEIDWDPDLVVPRRQVQ